MSTKAKTPLYAAVGAGAAVLDAAKGLPKRVISLPQTLQAKLAAADIRDLPKTVKAIDIRDLPKSVQGLNMKPKAIIEQAMSLSATATGRATDAYAEFAKVGEKTVKGFRTSSPKASVKKTTAKVKATAAKKSAESNGASTATPVDTATNN